MSYWTADGQEQSIHVILCVTHCFNITSLTFGIRQLLSSPRWGNMDMHTRGGMEHSTSNRKKVTPEKENGTDLCIQFRIHFFPRNLSKILTALLYFKIQWPLLENLKGKKYNYQWLAFWLSNLPPLRIYRKTQDSLRYTHLCRYEGCEILRVYL